MPIYFPKSETTFTPAPQGTHQSVCCDVVDAGVAQTQWGPKRKIKIVWQLGERDPKTKKLFTVSQRYTFSRDERSNLRQMIDTWRAHKKFTPEEIDSFDLEQMIGANALLSVVHNISDGGNTYANVQAVMPVTKGTPLLTIRDYVREIDRQNAEDDDPALTADGYSDRAAAANPWKPKPEVSDEDIPF